MKFAKKEVNRVLLLVGILILLSGCYKNADKNNIDEKNEITANVIEDSKGNCRLVNESDCRPIEIRRGEAENDETNNTKETVNLEKNTNKTINLSEEVKLSNCEEGWKCVEKNYRAYQFSNCSWTSVEYCVYGCKNGTCNPPPVCKPSSLKCDNDNVVKCEDGYEWKLNESCDYQCLDGVCISKNETAVSTANLTNATNSNNTTNLTNTTNSNNTTTNTTNNYITDGCMSVPKYNLTGNKSTDEYFTLKNSCSYQIDMSSWTATDDANHVYTFPSFNLASNGDVTIVTGSGINNQTKLYWGRGSAVWNNGGDTLYLNASNGASVLIKILTP